MNSRPLKAAFLLGAVIIVPFLIPAVGNAYRVHRYPQTYQELQEYWDGPSTFPAQIPAEARHARVYRQAGWGQGGSRFQLRYQLPPAAFQALVGTVLSRPRVAAGNLPRFYTGGGGAFPAGYALYTFTDAGNINHGFREGIALNSDDNEVVHWHESW